MPEPPVLSPAAARLLLALPPRGWLNARAAAHLANLASRDVDRATSWLINANLAIVLSQTNAGPLLELTVAGRLAQRRLSLVPGRSAWAL